jgi:hypothetical protein
MSESVEVVEVVLAHPWAGHQVGERLSLGPDDARRLVQAAAARYVDQDQADDQAVDEARTDPGAGVEMEAVEVPVGETGELDAGDGTGTPLPPAMDAHPAAWHALDATGELAEPTTDKAPPAAG